MSGKLRPVIVPSNAHTRFSAEVCAGLSKPQKSIPSEFFYDETGSQIFEQITQLEEYYPTRTEIEILRQCVRDIAARTIDGTILVEFGSGFSVKTEIILGACPAIRNYIPIDVSPTILEAAEVRLRKLFPALRVEPMVANFAADFALPTWAGAKPKLGFFPGSTIGNFTHEQAVELLSKFRSKLGRGARLIIGADLRKSPDVLIPAYNDALGVTAAFNLNLLARINRELGGSFDLLSFDHVAAYDIEAGRIDMFLISKINQSVSVAGRPFHFKAGERIHTEISQKYEVAELQGLARRAGWMAAKVWTDPAGLFSVHEFVAEV